MLDDLHQTMMKRAVPPAQPLQAPPEQMYQPGPPPVSQGPSGPPPGAFSNGGMTREDLQKLFLQSGGAQGTMGGFVDPLKMGGGFQMGTAPPLWTPPEQFQPPPPTLPVGKVPPRLERFETAEAMKDGYRNNWQPNPIITRLLGGRRGGGVPGPDQQTRQPFNLPSQGNDPRVY